jgi:rhamnulose-1-phosphate aldolase
MTSLEAIIDQIGRAGRRLDSLHACEAAAGNISVAQSQLEGIELLLTQSEPYELPVPAPALAGWTVLVTGSGVRLRDVLRAPETTLTALIVGPDGHDGRLLSSPKRAFSRPTSEFNSHLAVHQDQVASRCLTKHALVHAQPPHLVALSHRPEMLDSTRFSRRIMRWEPETVVQLPDGLAVLPFMVPGSDELRFGSVEALRSHRIVIWSKHGLLARSDSGPLQAVDLIEYAEAGAMYCQLNAASPSPVPGLTDDELRAVIEAFSVRTQLF